METKTFINLAQQIHGNKYNYSKSCYITALIKLCVICPEHGEFFIRPNNHISGKQGCKQCGIQKRPQNRPKSVESFVLGCNEVHEGKYDYSKINYINNNTKVEIVCLIHGSFFQTPNAHLNGQGCPLCNRNHHKSISDYNNPTKVCNRCYIEKPVEEYYIDGVYYRGNCKECEKEEKVEYRKIPINKERISKYHKKYRNNRRLIDPVYRIRVDIPSIIRRATKKKYYNDSVWNYLPYTPQELKHHLEKQFDTYMTWDNHGKEWHIDHIIPQAAFHYDSENHPDFLKCWTLNNLRPLRAIDNMRKSSIYNGKRVINKYL
jgi:hypothetical protein